MKKDLLTSIKNQWLRIWIAFMTLSLFSFSVSAEYQPQSNIMKRVVVSTSEPIYKFSSDVLSGGSVKTYVPQYKDVLGENANPNYYEIPVHIRNYSTKASASWYDEEIVYNVSFKFTDIKGNQIEALPPGDTRTVGIYKKTDSGETHIATLSVGTLQALNLSQTLERDSAHNSQDTYYLRFSPNWDLTKDENVCVQMKAEPIRTGGKYNDLRNLGAVIGLKRSNGDTDSGWHAFLDEENAVSESNPVSVFDGYNLIITGSGKATIAITWDTSYFELNKYFHDHSIYKFASVEAATDPETGEEISPAFNEITKTDVGDISTITINADSGSELTNHRTRYNIQVYNTGKDTYDTFNFFAVYGDANYDSAKIKVTINQE
ncbi:hypothetical protein [Ruminococcus flavefaciens]|uniref:hypothetical protein n=1 Tax=Ruminococcus flavefaciens TaxID=1265 RepID=UPI0026EDF042|nr:hypothetical protein [Ruminococcus flavefaciens]